MKKLVARFASPAGLLLAALLFLFLPFTSVACETGVGEVRIDYSGLDVAVNGKPSVDVPPAVEEMMSGLQDLGRGLDDDPDAAPPKPAVDTEAAPSAGTFPMVLGIVTLALLVIGLAVTLLPVARRRPLVTAGVAGAAAALLIATQIVTDSLIHDSILDSARRDEGSRLAGRIDSLIDQVLGAGSGFWLALILTLLVALGAVAVHTAPKWRHRLPRLVVAPAGAPPPEDPPPPGVPDPPTTPFAAQPHPGPVAELPEVTPRPDQP